MPKGVYTFRPKSTRRRARVHGFMARIGSRVLKLRRLKGRKRLTVV
jgi:ribosomal protein L34